jgi:hypothetical protein
MAELQWCRNQGPNAAGLATIVRLGGGFVFGVRSTVVY